MTQKEKLTFAQTAKWFDHALDGCLLPGARSVYEMAKMAVDRRIPKKPEYEEHVGAKCAVCGWLVETWVCDVVEYPFCPMCGQAIDWRERK